jgi:hypothetical protein
VIRWYLAKFLQLSGISMMPTALFLGVTAQNGMTLEVRFLALGVMLFAAGWLVEGKRET